MDKSWEGGWQNDDGQSYQVRLFEDAQGQEPAVFIVERSDGSLMDGKEAQSVHQNLTTQLDIDPSESKFWEQSPDGNLYELSYQERQYDTNPAESDLPPGEYQADVEAGQAEPNIASTVDLSRREVTQDEALTTTGHEIQSYEQQMAQDWSELRGPSYAE